MLACLAVLLFVCFVVVMVCVRLGLCWFGIVVYGCVVVVFELVVVWVL